MSLEVHDTSFVFHHMQCLSRHYRHLIHYHHCQPFHLFVETKVEVWEMFTRIAPYFLLLFVKIYSQFGCHE